MHEMLVKIGDYLHQALLQPTVSFQWVSIMADTMIECIYIFMISIMQKLDIIMDQQQLTSSPIITWDAIYNDVSISV